ncbi:unnamed protein product [Larinioides sclopetarius]|uniref:Uncharacterized protein n=1 Tax=Larinioides sclopetarius TaxID=280406 RepID=A0AAV2ACI6_9ARAC
MTTRLYTITTFLLLLQLLPPSDSARLVRNDAQISKADIERVETNNAHGNITARNENDEDSCIPEGGECCFLCKKCCGVRLKCNYLEQQIVRKGKPVQLISRCRDYNLGNALHWLGEKLGL